MINSTQNNKRIAKNTLLLYFRMLFIMVVSLYTSRVVLQILGVEDYGIYNVVGGVVFMFSAISGSLSAAISRFITYELGKGNKKELEKIFSTSVTIQIVLGVIILILAELIGIWFLNNKMNIPINRMHAANWVFQLSILTFLINLISIPYNAVIVAHEKMSAFAYISILEAISKLIIVYLLKLSPLDKLIFYSILMASVAFIIRLVYVRYCKRHFDECNYNLYFEKNLLKQMFSFAGWQFFGTGSYILMTQGVNILLNIYFGPIVNASRGIAVQVDGVIQQFVNNFTTAINPQITKSYATNNKQYMLELIYSGAKYSFFLVLFISIPIIIETKTVLELWLQKVPDYTINFIRLILAIELLYALSSTMMTAMLATGRIKKYQIIVGGTGMLVFPITWLFFKLGFQPETAFIIQFIIFIIQLIYRLKLLNSMIGLSIKQFINKVIIRAFIVTTTSLILPLVLNKFIIYPDIIKFVIVVSASITSTLLAIYYLGLTSKEKSFIITTLKSKMLKK